jgi:hypothetical protein
MSDTKGFILKLNGLRRKKTSSINTLCSACVFSSKVKQSKAKGEYISSIKTCN